MKSLEEIRDAIKRITVEENRPLKGNKGPLKQVLEGLLDIVNGLETETSDKQDILVSGENIKTINGQSILGEGDLIPNGMVETTWAELKELRDNAQLVPGTMYRITDYMTTTAQEDTRSAGHQFDIIVTALTESVLSEDAKAIQHEFEWPEECYSSGDGEVLTLEGTVEINGTLYYSYILSAYSLHYAINAKNPRFISFNDTDEYPYVFLGDYFREENQDWEDYDDYLCFTQDLREFSYFSNSNLAAWKLKYCLDNDENRFAWASEGHPKQVMVDYGSDVIVYYNYVFSDDTQLDGMCEVYHTEDTRVGGTTGRPVFIAWGDNEVYGCEVDGTNIDESTMLVLNEEFDGIPAEDYGKGVIYQMIDERNNNCPYDFKNIQFLRSGSWLNTHDGWADEVLGSNYDGYYFYTFSWFDASNSSGIIIEDVSTVAKADDEDFLGYAKHNTILEHVAYKLTLNNIIIVSSTGYEVGLFYPMQYNTFKENCRDCSFGNMTQNNVFDAGFFNNVFCNYTVRNKSFGQVMNLEVNEDRTEYIIYFNNGSAQFKKIEDAFSSNT